MTKEEFCSIIGVELDGRITAFYCEDAKEYSECGAPHLTEEYIISLDKRFGVFPTKLDFVLRQASAVREDSVISLLSLMLVNALKRKGEGELIPFPTVPKEFDKELTLKIEMAAFFAIVAFAESIVDYAVGVGMPLEVALDTANVYELYLDVSRARLGREGFLASTYYSWNQRYINHTIFKIGILNYEIVDSLPKNAVLLTDGSDYKLLMDGVEVGEGGIIVGSAGCNDTLYRAELSHDGGSYCGYESDPFSATVLADRISLSDAVWHPVADPESRILSVHIPKGCSLTEANIKESYRKAIALMDKCFPERKVALIYCCSWLLNPKIKEMLSEGSNIVAFLSTFKKYPVKSAGRGVFSFLFNCVTIPNELSSLPENTSLQRAVKRFILDGGHLYEVAGLIDAELYR